MLSIAKSEAEVDAELSSVTNSANITSVGAESNGVIVVPTTNYSEQRHLFAKELKELVSFKALMEADRHQFKQTGEYSMCCCPFHRDRTPSFSIYQDDNRAKCFGCDWYGDIFNYEMDFHKVGFGQALGRLNNFYYDCPRAGRKAKTHVKPIAQVELSKEQIEQRNKYIDRLVNEPWLAGLICQKRNACSGENWNPQTILKISG
jgi:hypothetical protein